MACTEPVGHAGSSRHGARFPGQPGCAYRPVQRQGDQLGQLPEESPVTTTRQFFREKNIFAVFRGKMPKKGKVLVAVIEAVVAESQNGAISYENLRKAMSRSGLAAPRHSLTAMRLKEYGWLDVWHPEQLKLPTPELE